MQEEIGEDGCPIFTASVALDLADQDKTFKWGVVLDGPQGAISGAFRPKCRMSIPSSAIGSSDSTGGGAPQVERYYFTYGRRLGREQTLRGGKRRARPAVCRLGAQRAERWKWSSANRASGYIADDGTGIDPAQPGGRAFALA